MFRKLKFGLKLFLELILVIMIYLMIIISTSYLVKYYFIPFITKYIPITTIISPDIIGLIVLIVTILLIFSLAIGFIYG